VKIVVDAYEGDVRFYVVDPADPVLRTYRAALPGLFRPLAEMPSGLRQHCAIRGTCSKSKWTSSIPTT